MTMATNDGGNVISAVLSVVNNDDVNNYAGDYVNDDVRGDEYELDGNGAPEVQYKRLSSGSGSDDECDDKETHTTTEERTTDEGSRKKVLRSVQSTPTVSKKYPRKKKRRNSYKVRASGGRNDHDQENHDVQLMKRAKLESQASYTKLKGMQAAVAHKQAMVAHRLANRQAMVAHLSSSYETAVKYFGESSVEASDVKTKLSSALKGALIGEDPID